MCLACQQSFTYISSIQCGFICFAEGILKSDDVVSFIMTRRELRINGVIFHIGNYSHFVSKFITDIIVISMAHCSTTCYLLPNVQKISMRFFCDKLSLLVIKKYHENYVVFESKKVFNVIPEGRCSTSASAASPSFGYACCTRRCLPIAYTAHCHPQGNIFDRNFLGNLLLLY